MGYVLGRTKNSAVALQSDSQTLTLNSRIVKTLAISVAVTTLAVVFGTPSHAETPLGNYELHIQGRYDFHTLVWAIGAPSPSACPPGCVHVAAIPRPNAKAFQWQADAQLNNGQYTLTVDDTLGLRCGDIYYGPVIPTHDIYSWDATPQSGAVNSSFDTNCGGAPGGTYTYPFTLTRM